MAQRFFGLPSMRLQKRRSSRLCAVFLRGAVPFLIFCPLVVAPCLVPVLRSLGASQQPTEPSKSPSMQTEEEASRKSAGCISCHGPTDEPTMHPTKTVHLGCTDCHGGKASI